MTQMKEQIVNILTTKSVLKSTQHRNNELKRDTFNREKQKGKNLSYLSHSKKKNPTDLK